MNIRNLKKFFVAGAALVMMLGLSACHHWHERDRGHGYYGSSHWDRSDYDRRHDDGGYYRRGYRR